MTSYLTLSVCTVFKRYVPTIFISSDVIKFTKDAKYLVFTFNGSKYDDSPQKISLGSCKLMKAAIFWRIHYD